MAEERRNAWLSALSNCGVCLDNPNGDDITGCLCAHGAVVQAPDVTVIDGPTEPDGIQGLQEERFRITVAKFDGVSAIINTVKESSNFGNSFLTAVPNQRLIGEGGSIQLVEGLRPTYELGISQSNSTFDARASNVSIMPFENNSSLQIKVYRPGKLLGGAAYHEIYDNDVGEGHRCSVRFAMIMASSFTMPVNVEEYHKYLTVGNMDVFTTDSLLAQVNTKRVKEVTDRVNKSRQTNSPVLVIIPNELANIGNMSNFLTEDCMLEMVVWGEFSVYVSPVIGHMLEQLTVADNVLAFDFNSERVRNASGVLCCIGTVGDNRRYGLGAPLLQQDKNFRHPTHNDYVTQNDYVENFRRGNALPRLILPETVIKRMPQGLDDTEHELMELMRVNGSVAYDMEYHPETYNLGTLAFCYRKRIEEEEKVVVLLLRKQVMGDEVFDQTVKPALLQMLRGSTNLRLVVFDFRQDQKALKINGIIDVNSALDGVIDLRINPRVGACFRLMYHATGKPTGPQGIETTLGLVNFVWMALGCDLDKTVRIADWDTVEVQNNDVHINYAMLDAYAIHHIIVYCGGVL